MMLPNFTSATGSMLLHGRRRYAFALHAVPLLLLLAGCGPTERGGAAGAYGGTLVVVSAGDASSLLPPFVADAMGRAITDQLYDRLAEIPRNLNTVGDVGWAPRLADHWTWAKDSMSIAFHIDPRARWHDGVPVRASDVRFSHSIYSNPKAGSPVTPLVANIDSVSVRDSLTAVVWYRKHEPAEFYDFVYQEPIIPEHVLKDIPVEQLRTSDVARHPIGTGRFRFVRWDAGMRIEIIADTANFRGRAKLDRVIWNVVPDFGAAFTQVLTGQADLLENVPPDQVARVDSTATLHAIAMPTLDYAFVGFNGRDAKRHDQPHPIFGDGRVRRALSMAVDRVGMLHNVFGTAGSLAYGPFPKALGSADTALRELPYDTTAARALLDSAGWKEPSPGAVRMRNGKPLRFSILVPASSKPRMTYAVLLQSQFRKVGAQVDLDQQQFNAVMGRVMDTHDFDAVVHAWQTDPGLSGEEQNWSTSGMAKGGQNVLSYSNPRVDALLDSAVASFDPARANAYARRAYQIIIDDAPAIWLYDLTPMIAVSRRFQVPDMRADEGWWPYLADWSIPADQRIDRDRIGLAAGTK